jgi:glutamate synthase (NADPH/NADH) small chain
MGKVGAYIDLGRVAHGERPAAETLKDFGEFAVPLDEKDQRSQASRCMYCGVAFCQTGFSFGKARSSGCPLHNLIPEWNDLMWRGM